MRSRLFPALALLPALAFLAIVALSACDKSKSEPSKPAAGGTASPPSSAADLGLPAARSTEDERPIQLTDERLDKYMAYRREYNVIVKKLIEDMEKVSKAVDAKTSELGKSATALAGAAKVGETHDAAVKALRGKYGFNEEEDRRLWDAVGAVLGAKTAESPAMQESIKMFRDMQAKGGEEKKSADEFFKNMEASEKEGLEEARKNYGAQCVEVLSKHLKELNELQEESFKTVLGVGAATPK